MGFEGFFASFSPSFEPLTDRSRASSQRSRNVLLLPAFLFQLPRLFSSFFSPIGGSPVLPYLLFYHSLLLSAEISNSSGILVLAGINTIFVVLLFFIHRRLLRQAKFR